MGFITCLSLVSSAEDSTIAVMKYTYSLHGVFIFSTTFKRFLWGRDLYTRDVYLVVLRRGGALIKVEALNWGRGDGGVYGDLNSHC